MGLVNAGGGAHTHTHAHTHAHTHLQQTDDQTYTHKDQRLQKAGSDCTFP